MAYDPKLKEEEIKNKVAADLFPSFDCSRILGNVDFCVQPKGEGPTLWETESLLWAEAKNGSHKDFAPLFAQLVLTIGGEKTFETYSPPPFLGAFDSIRIAFVPWHAVLDLFFRSDIDWTATPSNTETSSFSHVLDLVRPILDENIVAFEFGDSDLAKFVKKNLVVGNARTDGLNVTRNNFPFVYQKWVKSVKPSIAVNWEGAKRQGIHDADFFLADLLSKDNATLMQKLFVVLRGNHYLADRHLDPNGFLTEKRVDFNDGQKAHAQFWNQYRRPPRREFWDFINDRRDLLMPSDIRERQGSFFTPQIWVEKAQEAIAEVLGENWQDDHYVWDCAGGTGNLVAGLDPKAKYRVWVSTLQRGDVDIMHERIRNGAALLDAHVFQFDFLNDDFGKLPQGLRDIIDDPEKRKKLVVFINPPYAEAGSTRLKKSKVGVSNGTSVHRSGTSTLLAFAKRELFIQFLARIYYDIPGCIIAEFSKLKHLNGPYFKPFRDGFRAKLRTGFLVPAETFDNVSGQFPIGFMVWDTRCKERFEWHEFSVFDKSGKALKSKLVLSYDGLKLLNDWMRPTWRNVQPHEILGWLVCNGNDFQHQNEVAILSRRGNNTSTFFKPITMRNTIKSCVYFAVRLSIEADWLNDRDQFLWPADSWKTDNEFQLDCLVYALFHGQNRISCKVSLGGTGCQLVDAAGLAQAGDPQCFVNHWIPFPETEVDAKDAYKSHFMVEMLRRLAGGSDFNPTAADEPSALRQSHLFTDPEPDLFAADAGAEGDFKDPYDLKDSGTTGFSSEARAVLNAGRRLYRYYHMQPTALPDASFYDIRAHFQGFKPNGHMNPDSPDAEYTRLVSDLRAAMRELSARIAPKVREHGFLR